MDRRGKSRFASTVLLAVAEGQGEFECARSSRGVWMVYNTAKPGWLLACGSQERALEHVAELNAVLDRGRAARRRLAIRRGLAVAAVAWLVALVVGFVA